MCVLYKPFPDESLYSILCRYALINGVSSLISLKKQLISKFIYNSKIGAHDTVFIIKIFSELADTSLDSLINDHTLMSLYRSFSYINCKQSSIRFMNSVFNLNSNGNSIRLCEECYIEDIKKYGVAYWHRSHSIPYIDYCHLHKVSLKRRRVSDLASRTIFLMPDIHKTELYSNDEEFNSDLDIKASENSHVLLNTDSRLIGIEELLSRIVYDIERKEDIGNLRDLINNEKNNLFSAKCKNTYNDSCYIKLFRDLLIFLFLKKTPYKRMYEFLAYEADNVFESYGNFGNMFTLCRDFINKKGAVKYRKLVREIRENYLNKEISDKYNVNNLLEVL